MKRITVLTLSISILLLGSLGMAPINANHGNQPEIDLTTTSNNFGLDQDVSSEGSYYPIFVDISSNDTILNIRDRNNTLGEGAIVQVQENSTITFRYGVALKNTTDFVSDTVNFRLFADLPVVNTTVFNNTAFNTELSLTNANTFLELEYSNTNTTNLLNYTLPDGSVIDNATLYYYENTEALNLTVSYLPFFVRDSTNDSLSETASSGAFNLLTTTEYFTSESQDEFYIQNEKVNITSTLFFDDTGDENDLDLGLNYRIDGGTQNKVNLTLVYDGNNGTGWLNLTDFEIGTTISWETVLYVGNDTMINQSRIISNIDSKVVEVGDGSPRLDIKIITNDENGYTVGNTTYSTNFTIEFIIETSVPKGNITDLYLLATDSDTNPKSFDKINDSFQLAPINQTVDYLAFTSSTNGDVFNTTIVTLTDKGIQVNETFTIYIDQQIPQITSILVAGGASVQTEDGYVTFNFGFSDEISGVRMAILEFGDNSSREVTSLNTFTHKYQEFDHISYEYTLTVYDHAGNVVSQSGVVTLTGIPVAGNSAPIGGAIVFMVVLILLITSFIWGPRVTELFNR